MSDETTTAVIDAPASDASSSAPSTPATSSPAPATSSSPTAATPSTESATSTGDFKAPARNEGEQIPAYLKRTREAREAHEKGQPAPKTEAAVVVPPAAAPVTEAAKPAEVKTEDAKTEDEGDDDLIPEVGIATTQLAEKLKADPDLEAKLEAAGLKSAVFANARLADKANQFIQEFPGGLDEAKFVKQHAAERESLESGFTTITTPQDAQTFLRDVVMPMSYQLGEDGKPIPDGNGGFVNDGTVERFMDNIVNLGVQLRPDHVFKQALATTQGKELLFKEIQALAKADGDEEMQAVLEIVKDRLDKRGSSSAASVPQTDKEKELAQRTEAVKAEENRLAQQRQTEATERANDNERAVATSISQDTNKLIDQVLGKFAIPEFTKAAAREKIRTALYERVSQDAIFKMQADQMARKQYGTKTHQERVGLAISKAKSYIWAVAEPIIKEAGGELVAANAAKHAKINTQIESSRKEPKGGITTPSGGPAPLSAAEMTAKAKENLTKAGKDPSDVKNIIAEARRIRAGQ